jgi:hypothetical protein
MVPRPPPKSRPERKGGYLIVSVAPFIDENIAPLHNTCGEGLKRCFHANGIGRFLLCLPFTLPVCILDSWVATVLGCPLLIWACCSDQFETGDVCGCIPSVCEFTEAGRGFDDDDSTNANLGFCSHAIFFICPILDPITTFCLRGTRCVIPGC